MIRGGFRASLVYRRLRGKPYGCLRSDDNQRKRAVTNLVRTFQAEVSAKNPAERRLNIRLLDYWQILRGERLYPAIQDFNFDAVEGLKSCCFLLEFSDGDIDPVFRYIGDALTEDCGQNMLQKPVSEVPRHTLLTQVTDHYLQVLAHKAPIAFEAEYIDAAGDDVLYRSILLPLSSDGETIDCVVGAINRKEKSSETTIAHAGPKEGAEILGIAATVEGAAPDVSAHATDLARGLEECQALASAVDAADIRSRDALYRALEAAYGFYFACQSDPAGYSSLLAASRIKTQARAPFTPIVKLVFGTAYDKTRLSEYATALAYAKRKNQIEITVKNFIETQAGGIKGCVAAERAARRAERGTGPDQLERARRDLRALPPLAEVNLVEKNDVAEIGGEFVLVLGRRSDENSGKVQLLRVLDEPPALVDAVVKRAAKSLAGAAERPGPTARIAPQLPFTGPGDGGREGSS